MLYDKQTQISEMEFERIRLVLAPIVGTEVKSIAQKYNAAIEMPRVSKDTAGEIAGHFFSLAVAHR